MKTLHDTYCSSDLLFTRLSLVNNSFCCAVLIVLSWRSPVSAQLSCRRLARPNASKKFNLPDVREISRHATYRTSQPTQTRAFQERMKSADANRKVSLARARFGPRSSRTNWFPSVDGVSRRIPAQPLPSPLKTGCSASFQYSHYLLKSHLTVSTGFPTHSSLPPPLPAKNIASAEIQVHKTMAGKRKSRAPHIFKGPFVVQADIKRNPADNTSPLTGMRREVSWNTDRWSVTRKRNRNQKKTKRT